MSKSFETSTTPPPSTETTTGTGTGGSGTPGGPHPKRVIEIVLLFAILILVAYDTYVISQNHELLQSQQVGR